MATTPQDPKKGGKPDQKPDLEQQMLMREVDEAVRTDEVSGALRKYGLPVGTLLVLALLAFGGWLWWDGRQEAALEEQSEMVVLALDELDAGNLDAADQELALVDGEISPAALASAKLYRALIALEQGRTEDAVAFYDEVANIEGAPQPMRDAAKVRLVYANYDNMQPQEVVDRLSGLAVDGSPWFGSAGEMVFHAYLDMDDTEAAGELAIAMADSTDVPETIKARVRQLAGRYGFDTINDVEEELESMRADDGADASE